MKRIVLVIAAFLLFSNGYVFSDSDDKVDNLVDFIRILKSWPEDESALFINLIYPSFKKEYSWLSVELPEDPSWSDLRRLSPELLEAVGKMDPENPYFRVMGLGYDIDLSSNESFVEDVKRNARVNVEFLFVDPNRIQLPSIGNTTVAPLSHLFDVIALANGLTWDFDMNERVVFYFDWKGGFESGL